MTEHDEAKRLALWHDRRSIVLSGALLLGILGMAVMYWNPGGLISDWEVFRRIALGVVLLLGAFMLLGIYCLTGILGTQPIRVSPPAAEAEEEEKKKPPIIREEIDAD